MIKKRFSLLIAALFILATEIYANSENQVQEYTLENGMQVFLLEDSQDARIHIEYTCRAGFSSQTQSTCGFFKLFSRMIRKANPNLDFTDIQCNADSSRYFLDVSPSQLQDSLTELSNAVFSPDFSDEVLKPELNALKKEVSSSANDMGTYINAAIDSRVFSAAPWKHDSGIYPPLFKKTTEKTARSALKEISDFWYTPKNSAVFICGNINYERTLLMLKNSFGRFYSNYKTPVEKPGTPVNHQRKYVLHSPDISAELTQIVVQYTMLNMEQSDLLAIALGYENSLFKQLVLSCNELNIPGDEYINVSAAHKKDSSRLIIQTLLQPPAEKKKASSTNSYKQTELFLSQLEQIKNTVRSEEFEYAKRQSEYNMESTAAVPQHLMETLSSFWALKPYMLYTEADTQNFASKTTALMMSRINKLHEISLAETLSAFETEAPFIFVIINSKDYKANKKAYENAGFEEINEKNASWYVQTMFNEMKKAEQGDTDKTFYTIEKNIDDNSYYQKNKDSINTFILSNSIPVITKQNPLSSRTSLVLSINGGKYSSADDNGFEEVMINLLAGLIQKKLYSAQAEGILTGAPYITSRIELNTSQVIIEFDSVDTIAVLKNIADSIVYGEIAPADADRAVSARKYRKRLENGTAANQMYYELMKTIYGNNKKTEIFDAENEILLDTDYTKILSAYPKLLDASRYTLIFCGNIMEEEKLSVLLEESFGLLANNSLKNNFNINDKTDISNKTVNFQNSETEGLTSRRDITVKIRHTFLTDIPAEKAGPQPAVLIPTTEFLDPVIYAFKAPSEEIKKTALFNAVLQMIGTELAKAADTSVSVQLPKSGIDFGTLTVMNVKHIRELDSIYKTTVQKLSQELSKMQSSQAITGKIKNNWIQTQMHQTSYDTGTALLIQRGFELSENNKTVPSDNETAKNSEIKKNAATFYLDEYKLIMTANSEDFLEILEYFPVRPTLRVYSADAKK